MARLTVERTADGLDEEWVVKREGAEALSFRLEQQMQWQEATAVRAGRQPPVDPDGAELEGIDDGVRVYRTHEVPGMMDGHAALVTQRLVKRLENDHWESDVEVECYRYADPRVSRR
jgi:hypothetical protein